MGMVDTGQYDGLRIDTPLGTKRWAMMLKCMELCDTLAGEKTAGAGATMVQYIEQAKACFNGR